MKRSSTRFRMAIDVGGTFTDLIQIEEKSRALHVEKVPTTPENPSTGVLTVIRKAGVGLDKISFFLHGTTLGVNAFLERKGVPTGLITTRGFRDVFEIARGDRPDMYDMLYKKPATLIPRYLRLEVDERVNYRGEIVRPLDKSSAISSIETFKRAGIQSIAICLLHSYANPNHELQLERLIKTHYPEASVSVSHAILKEYYEYERTVSTVVNAYIKPIVGHYVRELEQQLDRGRFGGKFLLMRSSGGAMLPREAEQTPVHTLLSGPSGGVMGGAQLSMVTGIEDLILTDAGGTSFDVSLILNGRPVLETKTVLGDYKLLLPVLDIRSIGAGGGSIAWLDQGKALQVGPQSAGANPGPICYKRGGTEPTVTDAAVALGYIDPRQFLGGEIPLDKDAAENGIRDKIAVPMGLSVQEAASGILTIAVARMAGVIRAMTIERGHDPRDFTLVSFGGAGPLFAASLGESIKARQILIPRQPANFSAWGMLTADLVHDLSRTRVLNLEDVDWKIVESLFEELEKEGHDALRRDGFPPQKQRLYKAIDARYLGQGHHITLRLKDGRLKESDRPKLEKEFHQLHERVYGHSMAEPVQLVQFRVRAVGEVPTVPMARLKKVRPGATPKPKATRKVCFHTTRRSGRWKVYDRESLLAGHSFRGPALVEEKASVTVVPPGQTVRIDDFGNILIQR